MTSPAKDLGYEMGYEHGESSHAADWALALSDVLPDDVEPVPSQVEAYIARLNKQIADLTTALPATGWGEGLPGCSRTAPTA